MYQFTISRSVALVLLSLAACEGQIQSGDILLTPEEQGEIDDSGLSVWEDDSIASEAELDIRRRRRDAAVNEGGAPATADAGVQTTSDSGTQTGSDASAPTLDAAAPVNRDGGAQTSIDASVQTPSDAAAPTSRDGGSVVVGTRSAGCGKAPPRTGNFTLQTTDGNGTRRSFDVYVPTSYDASIPRSLVVVYHGNGGNPQSSRAFGIQDAPGASSNAIFVYPQGIQYLNYGVGWNELCTGYDMPLFDNMLTAIKGQYCIDEGRVFAAGFSWGCDHVTALACCRGNMLKGISAASCSDEFSNPSDYRTYWNKTCPAAVKPAVRFTHDSTGGDPYYSATMFKTTMDLYRSFNGCSTTSSPVSPSPCVSYTGCSRPVVECGYPGLGHAMPASFGVDSWNFFATLR